MKDKSIVRERKLTDGSIVYSVIIYTADGKQVELDCVNREHAVHLFSYTNQLVDVTIWE